MYLTVAFCVTWILSCVPDEWTDGWNNELYPSDFVKGITTTSVHRGDTYQLKYSPSMIPVSSWSYAQCISI